MEDAGAEAATRVSCMGWDMCSIILLASSTSELHFLSGHLKRLSVRCRDAAAQVDHSIRLYDQCSPVYSSREHQFIVLVLTILLVFQPFIKFSIASYYQILSLILNLSRSSPSTLLKQCSAVVSMLGEKELCIIKHATCIQFVLLPE